MSTLGKTALICGGVIAAVAVLAEFTDNSPPSPKAQVLYDSRGDEPVNVEIEKWSWRLGGFDNVMILTSLILKNKEDFAVKDVRIACETFGESGTSLSVAAETIYQIIPAHGRRTIREFNLGWVNPQSRSAHCKLGRMSRAD